MPKSAAETFMLENYSRFAYTRFQRHRQYVLGSWSKWFRRTYDMRGQLVLDFGSGVKSAVYQQYQQQNGHVTGYRGYDACAEVQTWLEQGGHNCDFWNDQSLRGQFDLIIGNQIYEHLDREERLRLIARATELLKEGGRLVLTYPFALYNMNFRYFWEDITHKPVGVEAEAGVIALFGYQTQIYIGGLKGQPFGLWENLVCLFRNVVLLFPPFWLVNITARKDSSLRRV